MENFNKQNFIKISRFGDYLFRDLYISVNDLKTYTKINIQEPLSLENLKETETFKDIRGRKFYNTPDEYLDCKCENGDDYNNIKTVHISDKNKVEIYCPY
jgi:hypothetical protein